MDGDPLPDLAVVQEVEPAAGHPAGEGRGGDVAAGPHRLQPHELLADLLAEGLGDGVGQDGVAVPGDAGHMSGDLGVCQGAKHP